MNVIVRLMPACRNGEMVERGWNDTTPYVSAVLWAVHARHDRQLRTLLELFALYSSSIQAS